jgi:hypothetical protein
MIMSDLRVKDIYEGVMEQELLSKIAFVEKQYEGDTERLEMLDRAVDIVKEAMASNELPDMGASAVFSVAVELTEKAMLEKEAEDWEKIGEETGELLAEHYGITDEVLDKIATDEEAEDFLRFAARVWYSAKTGEDHVTEYLNQE